MAETAVDVLYGGEVSLLFGLQTNADPTVPLVSTSLVSAGFVGVPSITQNATLDTIRPLGTFLTPQRNVMDYAATVSLTQDVQDASILATGLRNTTGANAGRLNYYTMLFGNSDVAQVAIGAKCSSLDISIPRQGKAQVTATYEALLVAITSTVPAAMTYSTPKPFYGYSLAFNIGATGYSKLIKSIRINISHTLERLPPTFYVNGSTPTTQLVSSYIKEKQQIVKVSLELYNPIGKLTAQSIADVCASVNSITATLKDPCYVTAARTLTLTIPSLTFSADNLQAGAGQDMLNYTAEGIGSDLTIAYVPGTP